MIKFAICWLLTTVPTGEKQVQTDREFVTLSEKTQCPVHLTSEKVKGNLPQCFHTKRMSSQETLSDREGVSSGHQSVLGKGETFFRFSDPEEPARTVLEDKRDHLLAEAKSEILKQECRVDTLNTCIRDRLEVDGVNCGYEESRSEQARLHEELDLR